MIDIENELRSSINSCLRKFKQGQVDFDITPPKEEKYGDFTTNAAMVVASRLKKKPRETAEEIVANISLPKFVEKADIAGPGFINFKLSDEWFKGMLKKINSEEQSYGSVNLGKGKKVQVEFVSANPTGPLHIGHGRGAVYGDVLASLLCASGFKVQKEYYINDAGRQMRTLGASVYCRAKEARGIDAQFPEDGYKGEYIKDIAREVLNKMPDILDIPPEDAISKCTKYAGDKILDEIKMDLRELGIEHDIYFSESQLHDKGELKKSIGYLRNKGFVYDQDGATWFKSTAFGDDKDRVLIKNDGQYTYLAADIAYHFDKFERGFDWVIDIWGADHAGYVARMEAVIEALGHPKDSFTAVLIQLVNLVRAGKLVSMSTRSATYETLEDVRKAVGKDVCRYFFLMRSHTAQLDFDLELAEKHTPENPVFYIQYAHARISSVFKKAEAAGLDASNKGLDCLDLPEELCLMRRIARYPMVVRDAAIALEPHRIAFYLLELAKLFQSYYSRARADERYRFLVDDRKVAGAKLYLLKNVRQVLHNGLKLLGISAPEEMKREDGEDE